jgi:hypothetical protein
MIKIGLLISNINDNSAIQSNALLMNTFFLYDLLEKIENYKPIMILAECDFNKETIIYYNKNYDYIHFNAEALIRADITIFIQSFFTINYQSVLNLKKILPKVKIGYIRLGNPYYIDLSNYLYNGEAYNKDLLEDTYHKGYDFIWISPHYEHCISYVKTKSKNKNVYVSPYIWDSKIIENKIKNNSYEFNIENINNIGIFEGNILPTKSSIIPTYICDEVEDNTGLIGKVVLTNLGLYSKKQAFHRDIKELTIFKKNKLIAFSSSVKIVTTLKLHNINTIVSHQVYNGLNYLHLEALYMKMPLIHNSTYLKKYGYYYPEFNVEKGAKVLKKAINHHKDNLEKYNKLCEECIYNYSINNPKNINGYKKLIEKELKYNN